MRYFGGGIGHLKNAPPLQVLGFGPIDTNSDEMPVEDDDDDDDPFSRSDTNEDLGTIVQQSSRAKDVMNGDDEDASEDHDEEDDDSDGDEDGDQTDEDEDEEGEDGYGYASA